MFGIPVGVHFTFVFIAFIVGGRGDLTGLGVGNGDSRDPGLHLRSRPSARGRARLHGPQVRSAERRHHAFRAGRGDHLHDEPAAIARQAVRDHRRRVRGRHRRWGDPGPACGGEAFSTMPPFSPVSSPESSYGPHWDGECSTGCRYAPSTVARCSPRCSRSSPRVAARPSARVVTIVVGAAAIVIALRFDQPFMAVFVAVLVLLGLRNPRVRPPCTGTGSGTGTGTGTGTGGRSPRWRTGQRRRLRSSRSEPRVPGRHWHMGLRVAETRSLQFRAGFPAVSLLTPRRLCGAVVSGEAHKGSAIASSMGGRRFRS